MPNIQPTKTDAQPELNRRASDREGRERGIAAGGRRKTDRRRAMPTNKLGRIAILCSFVFSTGLLAWAFTLPFLSRGGTTVGTMKDLPEAELANLEYKARLSPQAYVDYARDIDQRVLDQYRQRNQSDSDQPNQYELQKQRQRQSQQREKELKAIEGLREGEGPLKGTIEWENKKTLESILEDSTG